MPQDDYIEPYEHDYSLTRLDNAIQYYTHEVDVQRTEPDTAEGMVADRYGVLNAALARTIVRAGNEYYRSMKVSGLTPDAAVQDVIRDYTQEHGEFATTIASYARRYAESQMQKIRDRNPADRRLPENEA